MCVPFLISLLGRLPDPSSHTQLVDWLLVIIQWLHLPQALLLRRVARNVCRPLGDVSWPMRYYKLSHDCWTVRLGCPLAAFGQITKSPLDGGSGMLAGTSAMLL